MTESNQSHTSDTSPGYASPQDAIQHAPREEFVYVSGMYTGTGVQEPDFLAVVDVNPDSDTYSAITHRLPMPNVGDELHHYGWQVCSSACHAAHCALHAWRHRDHLHARRR
jgi:selenium-binding protein 1